MSERKRDYKSLTGAIFGTGIGVVIPYAIKVKYDTVSFITYPDFIPVQYRKNSIVIPLVAGPIAAILGFALKKRLGSTVSNFLLGLGIAMTGMGIYHAFNAQTAARARMRAPQFRPTVGCTTCHGSKAVSTTQNSGKTQVGRSEHRAPKPPVENKIIRA